ncbi:MAG: hypothetical protein J3K34DRAFT_271984 [Monoraphidium minutum]|nr:MAG: hypothetical protein J3K34DRAFT_271984 [Monoraphidium minutum]
MARGSGARALLGLALLLLAGGGASAEQPAPLMAQAGDLLMMLTDAINTVREYRNTSSGGRSKALNEAAPVSDAPFSSRILRVHGSGGPRYAWRAETTATPANLTVARNETAVVKFVTRYTRSSEEFAPYSLHGALELRNLQDGPAMIQGPVKVVVTLKRPAGVTTGPESVETFHVAACGKAAPIRVPPRRKSGNAGVVRCNFEAVLPQAVAMMEAAEAAASAALAAPKVKAASADPLLAARPDALVPEVLITVQAPLAGVSAASAGPLAPPYRAAFAAPEAACLAVSNAMGGPLAKFIQPTGSYLPTNPRTVCAAGGSFTYIAKLGGWDAASCGTHALSAAPGGLGGAAGARAAVTVSGCDKTRLARPEITLLRLETVRVLNHTWSLAAVAKPLGGGAAAAGGGAGGAGGNGTLVLPAGGTAAANFMVKAVKGPAQDLGNRLRGEVSITSSSLVPEVMASVRLQVTSPGRAPTFIDLKCPALIPAAGVKCSFDAPWTATKIGSVQAQVKSLASKAFDVNSGTPRPFDFTAPEVVTLGACATIDRAYVGKSEVSAAGGAMEVRPLVNLVNGVDAFIGATRLNLSRIGMPADSFGELLGMADGVAGAGDKRRRGLLARAPAAAAAAPGAPNLHPLRTLGGSVPPAPGSKTPLAICQNETLAWTEEFGGLSDAACGAAFDARSTLTLAPNAAARCGRASSCSRCVRRRRACSPGPSPPRASTASSPSPPAMAAPSPPPMPSPTTAPRASPTLPSSPRSCSPTRSAPTSR